MVAAEDLVTVLDFNGKKAYSIDLDNPRAYKKTRLNKDVESSACGYAIEKRQPIFKGRKKLYSLFVWAEKIFFMAGDELFDVSSMDWQFTREKKPCFRYRLYLKEKNIVRATIDYVEFIETQAEDPDSHFFVDAMHWLKNDETRENLKKYWRGKLA